MILGRGGGFVVFLGKCVDVWLELWLDNDMSTNELRSSLLTELQDRHEAGEDLETVLAELKARPEWELVAKAQGLR